MLVGRDEELTRLRERLRSSRLLTLTGPGGSGKTSLAAALVATAPNAMARNGFVDLTAVNSPERAASAVAEHFGLRDTATLDPIASIVTLLGKDEALLGLDNLEQIVDIGGLIERLLHEAPNLRIVTTSRRPIGIPEEVEARIPPLALPTAATPEQVEASPAGALFLRRARAIGQLNQLDDRTATALAELLRRLDGLPLAIELAAARTRILSPGAILRRLDDPRTLAGPYSSQRHGSLAAVLEWSLQLLDQSELELIEAAAVCRGTFDIATAAALVPDVDVLPTLVAVVSHSLVERRLPDVNDEPRFGLLETVRSFLSARISADLSDRLHRRLAQHLVAAHAPAAARGRSVYEQQATEEDLSHLAADADNLRLALDWACAHDPDSALALAQVGFRYWLHRGSLTEGIDLTLKAVGAAPKDSPALAMALAHAARLAMDVDIQSGVPYATRALEQANQIGAPEARFAALLALHEAASERGDMTNAKGLRVEIEQTARETGDARDLLMVHLLEGFAGLQMGDLVAAQAAYRVAAELGSGLGDAYLEGMADLNFAVASGPTEPALALEAAIAGVAALRHIDAGMSLAWALGVGGGLLATAGRTAEAHVWLTESLGLVVRVAPADIDVEILKGLTNVFKAEGLHAEAARVLGCWRTLKHGRDVPLDRDAFTRAMKDVASFFDPIRFELELRSGELLTPHDLQLMLHAAVPIRLERPVPTARHARLSQREVEVLALVANGRTDKEIAEELFISPKTVSVHVSNAKSKLSASSRLDLALRARELGLAGDAKKAS